MSMNDDYAVLADKAWLGQLDERAAEAEKVGSKAIPVELDKLQSLIRLALDAAFVVRMSRDQIEALDDTVTALNERVNTLARELAAARSLNPGASSVQIEAAVRSWRDEADKLRRVGNALAGKVDAALVKIGNALPMARETSLYREVEQASNAWFAANGIGGGAHMSDELEALRRENAQLKEELEWGRQYDRDRIAAGEALAAAVDGALDRLRFIFPKITELPLVARIEAALDKWENPGEDEGGEGT